MATAANIASSEAGYVWEDPGDSIMVQLSLDLIERLGAAIQQGIGTGPRGAEVGGILLGRVLPGMGRAVLVEDVEPIPCEHFRGASFALSPRDRRVLSSRLSRRDPRQVVGYFRSHTRPGMYLDQDDFAVFSQYFPEAWQVLLLVRPSTDAVATGGFFFWEDGDINRRSTYRQFPFDVGSLAKGGFPITGDRAPTPIAPAAARPQPVLVPKPQAEVRRRIPLPSLSWVVVPAIGVLFLIAGFVVTENRPASPPPASAAKAIPAAPVVAPDTVPQQAEANASAPIAASEPGPEVKPVEVQPVSAAKTKPAKKQAAKAIAAPLVTPARLPAKQIEQPPAFTEPVARIEPKSIAAVLPAHLETAPPPEASVTYEQPKAGVFKRAFRKIEGDGDSYVPAAPIRQVAPPKPGDTGASGRPVDVKVFIDLAGNVSKAQAVGNGGELALAALTAARQWRFTPARKHDKPVSSEMVLHFHF